jgi:hypothetical protein
MEQQVDLTDEIAERQAHLIKASKEALRIDRARKEAFEALVKHPAWKMYQDLLNNMANDRGSLLLRPAGSVDMAIGMEFVKGTMNGLLLARDLPMLVISDVPAKTSAEDADDE